MEEVKKKKKIEISLGMAIFLIALFLFIIVAVIAGAIIINKKMNNIKNNEKGIVYTAYEKIGEGGTYSYSIPKINIDSEDVEDINKEIEEKYIEKIDDRIKEGYINYDYYINGEILSVIIEEGILGYTDYYICNINIKTGNKCSNEDILSYKNFEYDEILNEMPELCEQFFNSCYGEIEEHNEDDFYKEQLEKTISKENFSINDKMFLDQAGHVNVVVKIYAIAGAEYYNRIITIYDSQLYNEEEYNESNNTYVVCPVSNMLIFIDSGNAYYKKNVVINNQEDIEKYKKVDDKAIKLKTDYKIKSIEAYQLGTDVLTTLFLISENGTVLSTNDYDIEGSLETESYYFKDYEVEYIVAAKQIETEYDYPAWEFETVLKNGDKVFLKKNEDNKNSNKIDFFVKDSVLYIVVKYEKEFEKIEYLINGKTYVDYEDSSDIDKEKKEIKRKTNLISGENFAEVKIYNKDGTVDIIKGTYTYNNI